MMQPSAEHDAASKSPDARGSQRTAPLNIGQFLIDDGLITASQLARAERVAAKLKRPRSLESVLSELGFLFRRDLRVVFAKRGRPPLLGIILLEQGSVDPEAVDAALAAQTKGDKRRLGEILIAEAKLSERALLEALADQADLPLVTPELAAVDWAIIGKFSMPFLKRRCVLPMATVVGGILVLFSEVPDEETRHDLQKILGAPPVPALAIKGSIVAALQAIESGAAAQSKVAHSTSRPIPGASESPARPSTPKGPVSEPPVGALRPTAIPVASAPSAEVATLVDSMLEKAFLSSATEIHLEPLAKSLRVRYRVDGELETRLELPLAVASTLSLHLKTVSGCDVADRSRTQHGRFEYKNAGASLEVHLSILPSLHGESMVLRLLNRQKGILRLEELGMPPALQHRFSEEAIGARAGLMVLGGPKGSGRTSTLYAAIAKSNRPNTKIVTLEDPIEYGVDGIIQSQIEAKPGQAFGETFAAVVQQDPGIVVLGEIHDGIRASAAAQWALIGYKVFATLHAEDATQGILRLQQDGVDRVALASTISAMISQRLIRKICSDCGEAESPPPAALQYFGLTPQEVEGQKIMRGRGCAACRGTGFRGRTAIYEMIFPSEPLREGLARGAPLGDLRRLAVETSGMITLQEAGLAQVLRGVTTFEEIRDKTPLHPPLRPQEQVQQALGFEGPV